MPHLQKETRTKTRYFSMALVASFMVFLSVAGLLWINEAQALRISMKRIVFEGPKRSDVITIMNNTAKEQTYRLGWRHYRMDEKKSLIWIKEGDSSGDEIKWADGMIRYAPRRVTVPPGASQQIRILLRRPRDLEPGEYRSHLWIITETEAEKFSEDEKPRAGGQSFKLTMQPAITLPVFVRHGDLTASASITDVQLSKTEGGSSIGFVLHREGNRSLYGDIKIICTGGGQEYVASHTRGLAIYTEVDKRVFDYEFNYPEEHAGDCGRVRVEYVADRDDSLYGGQVMAQVQAGL